MSAGGPPGAATETTGLTGLLSVDSADRTLLASVSWLTLVAVVERGAGVVQTILVARALGITDYGVYGLIFGSIGLAASIAAMQMGLTATVFVARYRETNPERAAAVIALTSRMSWAGAILFLSVSLPFFRPIATWLLGPVNGGQIAVIAGCLLVALSILSGVMEGIIQGFEDFRCTALARLATTLTTAMSVYPAGISFGVVGVLAVVLAGVSIRTAYLAQRVARHRLALGIVAPGESLAGADLLWSFSLPSVLASLLVGAVGWSGTFVLSRQVAGFDGVALVTTGLQWLGPVMLMTSAVSTVVLPALSRRHQHADYEGVQRMVRRMLIANGGFALLAAIGLIAASPLILALYGPGFSSGTLVFSLLVLSSVPQVVAGVYTQRLVATGEMWRQLRMYLWLAIPLGAGYATMVPRFHSLGFALTHVCAWSAFAGALALTSRPDATLMTAEGAPAVS